MRHELQLLAKKKPLVVSLGDVGASGGYLVALPGRPVLAENATLTGSIGVFAGKFDLSGLLAKVGVSVDTHRRGAAPAAESSTAFRCRTPADEGNSDRDLRGFKDAVARGADLQAVVQAAAEGRV
jgi:protease-4